MILGDVEFTIFYAWQNDTPARYNRYLIRDVLENATKNIRNDALIEDSPRLDYDTRGVSGTPEIAATVFGKIKRCAVFIADMTFVGSTQPIVAREQEKLLPNPNVMLELGYAAATIGWVTVHVVKRYLPSWISSA